jgi:hypothetical protein
MKHRIETIKVFAEQHGNDTIWWVVYANETKFKLFSTRKDAELFKKSLKK